MIYLKKFESIDNIIDNLRDIFQDFELYFDTNVEVLCSEERSTYLVDIDFINPSNEKLEIVKIIKKYIKKTVELLDLNPEYCDVFLEYQNGAFSINLDGDDGDEPKKYLPSMSKKYADRFFESDGGVRQIYIKFVDNSLIKESIQSFLDFKKDKEKELLDRYAKEMMDSIINHPSKPIDVLKNIIDVLENSEIYLKVSLFFQNYDIGNNGYYVYDIDDDINDISTWSIVRESLDRIDEIDDNLINHLLNPTYIYEISFEHQLLVSDVTDNILEEISKVLKRIMNEYDIGFEPYHIIGKDVILGSSSVDDIKDYIHEISKREHNLDILIIPFSIK